MREGKAEVEAGLLAAAEDEEELAEGMQMIPPAPPGW
jgi:hypothetical protein